ncbi:MAG TPA: rod shape-determining protein RodA [Alphaproteobacteria bacterium]
MSSRLLSLHNEPDWLQKVKALNWGLVLLIISVASIGFLALYSAGGGHIEPFAGKHAMRFGVGFVGMMITAMISIRYWRALAWPLYGLGLLMLLYVDIRGHIGMGAQRWINLGFIQLQPSEFMKIVLVLALAAYYERVDSANVSRLRNLIPAALIILFPVGLVVTQPDLGTGMQLMLLGTSILFLAGVSWWWFAGGAALVAAALPLAWTMMYEYQRNRVRIFLNPESDPLGTGYHVSQAKIAMGSGGLNGKGFLQGTQARLNFLPEKETDFVFTLWTEEWGLIGGVALLGLFMMIFLYGLLIALRCRYPFQRLVAMGLTMNMALYVFINSGMVMGLLPVVGVPMPLVSHGGTAMLASMFAFGLILSASIHRDTKFNRYI